jgi:7-cyano-7-deazaguanine synthase
MKLNAKSALVVFSGGQDSTTCLGWALQQFESVRCVTFNYGQKHVREVEAAKAVIDFFKLRTRRYIEHEVIEIGPIFAGMSPLTNPDEQLETYSNHDEMEAIIGDRVEKTFVPMRNAVFLMLAANRAAVHGCGYIVTGICQADNANYPDCRLNFLYSASDTINKALGTENSFGDNGQLDVVAPLMDLSKAESVNLARTLPHTYAALQYSHTAYNGEYPPTGKDHASVLRAHGFEEAEVPDPLVLRAWREDLMELPETPNYAGISMEMASFLLDEAR